MKHLFPPTIAMLATLIPLGAQEAPRNWTQAATGKTINGILMRKLPDNSLIFIKPPDGKEIEVKTEMLIQSDKDYVSEWKSIVRGKATQLSQAQGGFKRNMEDLASVLSPYGKPIEATGPHSGALVYRGPAWYDGGPQIEVPYLMPFGKALAVLVKTPGPCSRNTAVVPGFPPGMITYEYDIKAGVYNRMVIVTDQADQVVALEVKSETKNNPQTPGPGWKQARMPNNSTADFIKPRTGGASVFVNDLLKGEKRIVIDSEFSGENLLFLPEPMIKFCLFHMSQDLRNK